MHQTCHLCFPCEHTGRRLLGSAGLGWAGATSARRGKGALESRLGSILASGEARMQTRSMARGVHRPTVRTAPYPRAPVPRSYADAMMLV
jgi:hypothetical protein